MKTRTLFLTDAGSATTMLHKLAEDLKPWLMAGHRLIATVRPETRNNEQNRKFHAICADLARSRHPWAGKARDAASWKVLLVSGHAVATKEGAEIVPGLESEFVNLRESTALMSVRRASSLIEYAQAFCAVNRIPLTDPALLAYASET